MLTPILSLGAGGLYLGAGFVLLRDLVTSHRAQRSLIFTLIVTGVLAHSILLYHALIGQPWFGLGFTYACSVVAWFVTLAFLGLAAVRPAENLGILILPLAAVGVFVAWIWPPDPGETPESFRFTFHLLFSMSAYAFLALAVVQALIMNMQEQRLKAHEPARLFANLPPIETMERMLFSLLWVGFGLLSVGLLTGFWFSSQQTGSAFVFNHKTVLSILAWVVFGTLLMGNLRFGWRGRIAVRWTIGGFVVLVLAYFGTQFILEFVLDRT